MTKITAKEFEERVLQVEGISITLRCPANTEVEAYPYKRASRDDTTLTEFKKLRLASLTNENIPYVIHDGSTEEPHGKTKLSSIRESYK